MAQPFDPERAELSGTPEAVTSKIGYSPTSGYGTFSVSSSGVLAWSPVFSALSKARLTWFDRSGVRLGDVGPAKSYNSVALSPDGKRIAASNMDTNTPYPLLILDLARGTTTDLGRQGASCLYPVWSPDASQIAYGAMRGGVPELFVQSSSGAGEEQGILENGRPKAPTDWSLDGRFLLYRESSDIGRRSLWTLAMKGDRKPERLLPADFSSSNGQFSPDGRWVAYAATESPVQQVYVQSFPPGRGKWQISTDGGGQPRWRHDGKELFYVDPLGKMMSVETKPGATSGPGPPKPLFTFRGSKNPWGTFRYDVTGDGRKFIILTPFEETSFDPLHIVLNWTAGLKK
jgi:Tol biopolymer transport system component